MSVQFSVTTKVHSTVALILFGRGKIVLEGVDEAGFEHLQDQASTLELAYIESTIFMLFYHLKVFISFFVT